MMDSARNPSTALQTRTPTVILILSVIVAGVLLLQIIDAALPQVRMALSGGYVGAGGAKLKPIFILAVAISFIFMGWRNVSHDVLSAWLLFVGYLGLLLPLHEILGINESFVSFIAFVDTYGYIFILPLALSLSSTLPSTWLSWAVLLISAPLCVLGVAQFVTSTPIVRPFSVDGQFLVNSWTIAGRARGFSLFTSGLRFGYFLALVIPLTLLFCLRPPSSAGKKSRLFASAMLVLALGALVATLTRNAYLVTLQALTTVFFLRHAASLKFVPVLHLAFSVLLTAIAALAGGAKSAGASVTSGDSLDARLAFWAHYSHIWLETDLPTLLFGAGISQFSRFSAGTVVIDNIFIATGVQVGLIGLLLFLGMLWALWRTLVDNLAADPDNVFLAAGVCFWSTFLSAGVLNNSSPTHLTFFFLVVLAGTSWSCGKVRVTARSPDPLVRI